MFSDEQEYRRWMDWVIVGRMQRLLICLALVVTFSSCSSLNLSSPGKVESSERIGTVLDVIGTPSILRDGRMIYLLPDFDLKVLDTVMTGAKDKVRIEMRDGTTINLGNNSEYTFLVYSHRGNFPMARMSFTQGSFRVATGSITKRPRAIFEVATPLATIGVRGTEFWGGYIFGDNVLDVALLSEGKIFVENKAGTVDIDQPGYGTTVRLGIAPTAPEAWSPSKANTAIDSTRL